MATFETSLQAACAYSALGWHVVPLNWPTTDGCSCQRGEDCASPGKHPWVRWRDTGGTTDRDQIRRWYRWRPESGVAILTGRERSGLFVIDVDPDHDGDETLALLEREHGPLPETLTAITGSGGRHLYFTHPGGAARQTAGALGPGLDTRSDGGLVVAAPSLHRSGRRYAWQNWGTAPAELPAWIPELLTPPPSHPVSVIPPPSTFRGARYAEVALERSLEELRTVAVEGVRNTTLNARAYSLGRLVGAGLISADRVGTSLLHVALEVGLGQGESEDTISSGLRAGARAPKGVPA